MMFRVGQKVVCVDAAPCDGYAGWGESGAPVKGSIYTVRRTYMHKDSQILQLDEINRSDAARRQWGPDVGYGAYRFRPIVEKKTDISIFTSMLNNVPLHEKETVGDRN